MKPIYVVDAKCGTGKTTSLVDFLSDQYHTVKAIINSPTKNLNGQIWDEFYKRNIKIFEINSSTTPGIIKHAIADAVKEINALGNGIIVCTDASHTHLPKYIKRQMSDWIHVQDEIPRLFEVFDFNIPYTHNKLTDLLRVISFDKYPKTYVILPNSISEIETFLKTNCDNHYDKFKPLLRRVIDDTYEVHVDKQAWDRLVINKIISQDPPGTKTSLDGAKIYGNPLNKLLFFTLLTPKIEQDYFQTILMGANLYESALVNYWHLAYGIKFIDHVEINNNILVKEHVNGACLEIVYLQENRASRYQATKIHEQTGKLGIELVIDNVKTIIDPNKQILAICNEDDKHLCPDNWKRISPYSHGLNKYRDYDQCVFIGAYNLSPKAIELLMSVGISRELIQHDMQQELVYQSVLRTKLRNVDNEEPVLVVVTSKVDAEYLASHFPGCILRGITGEVQKVLGKTNKSKKENRRMALLEETFKNYDLKEQDFCRTFGQFSNSNTKIAQESDKIDFETCGRLFAECNIPELSPKQDFYPGELRSEYDIAPGDVGITTFDSYSDPGKLEFGDVKSLSNTLKKLSKNNFLHAKTDQDKLFNACVYLNTNRQLTSVLGTSCIILDIDGGEMTIDDLNCILRDKLKWSYLAYSTVSHLVNNENHYRVIIFASMFMSPLIYNEMFDNILEVLENHNFFTAPNKKHENEFIDNVRLMNPKAKLSGIDMSKKNLSSIFKIPATLYGNEANTFFVESYLGLGRDFNRHVMNVSKILQSRLNTLKNDVKYEQSEYALITEQIATNDETNSQIVDSVNITREEQFRVHKERIIVEINEEVVPGKRSYVACRIGGKIRNWVNEQDKLEILLLLENKGCDENAMRSARHYAGLNKQFH